MGVFDVFKKKKVMNLTKLSPEEIAAAGKENNADYVDVGEAQNSSAANSDTSGVGFLSTLADSSSSSTSQSSDSELKERIEQLSDRVYNMQNQIDLLEKKIQRLERKSGNFGGTA